ETSSTKTDMENHTMVTEIILLGFHHLHSMRHLLFSIILVLYCLTISGNVLIIVLKLPEHTIDMENHTAVTEIILLGFHHLHSMRHLLFSIILGLYFLTISGNSLIIVLVSCCRHLHFPMYFFLTQMSISDILLTTSIAPQMLSIVHHEGGIISFKACITQYYFFAFFEALECFLLTVMSYDRYLAICNPLQYNSIMDHAFCIKLIVISWVLGFIMALLIVVPITQLVFCGPNIIDHFFCDFDPLLKLLCSDTLIIHIEALFICVIVLIIPFLMVIVSYVYIALTIAKIPSISGKKKAFSTCSSHLTVVSIYYGTLISIYTVPNNERSLLTSKILSMFFTVVTPMLNPIIYSLRNNDIREKVPLVVCSLHLHFPMYFFVTQMSISDILLTTCIAPHMLSIVNHEGGIISLKACITQHYFFAAFEALECLLLAMMSYDRYLAICNPLQYNSIMDHAFCIKLIVTCWLLGLLMALLTAVSITQLVFCGPNVIDHFFCDIDPLLKLACSDTLIIHLEALFLSIVVIIIPFLMKAFSTCSSHLTVVSIYYGTLISIYAVPTNEISLSTSKILSMFFTVVTPMLNPIIYSLRNNDIRDEALEQEILIRQGFQQL
ncbi:olfactory receptor, partial [Pelobates cultripes]